MTTHASTLGAPARRPTATRTSPAGIALFVALLAAGLAFSIYSLHADVTSAGPVATTWLPYFLLGVALLIALGFEFVNGFHDTANAVANALMHGRDDTRANLRAFKGQLDDATKFIPLWVKVAVAIALGLGTMVGWKRIVVTVGEKIGKSHLTYAQGASAETVAMLTIGAADVYGLPVSTTHVLSSGVAGTMAANRSGLQVATVRNLALAWVLTLPAAVLLSGGLYWLFSHLF